ncbi:hypothetical protein CCR75_004094 [Bremia lactucae]|uniref:tetraacyldisaccharide 4'-kinase n=1 Tax=Bremia lactucae TaxID=4779 RepID=A0A976IJ86_BRELC|nr:hypothetical protein CCR75_004094 [Bremia lactucae]
MWRHWCRQWHGSVLSALCSSRLTVEVLVDRKQPLISRVYAWIVKRKRREESSNPQRIAPPQIPVLSVGNVTFGATGKTPFVQFLLDYVLEQTGGGLVPLLLSRGYCDDEWRMLVKQFPTCDVALGADRVASGAAKVKELCKTQKVQLSCVIVDDGLQQWRLAKDLEIVMVDALHPLGNGLILPCGSLRELPREAFKRADIVIVHHADLLDGEELKLLMKTLKALVNTERNCIVAASRMKVVGLVSAHTLLSGEMQEANSDIATPKRRLLLTDKIGAVLCGVGNPKSVIKVVEKVARWAQLEIKAYPDHHNFTLQDANDIIKWVGALQWQRNESVILVTTEKDFARSPNAMEFLAANADLRVLQCKLELQYNGDKVFERLISTLKLV